MNEVRKLGVIFNINLTWNTHINSLTGKVYGMLRTLWVPQKFTPLRMKKKSLNQKF